MVENYCFRSCYLVFFINIFFARVNLCAQCTLRTSAKWAWLLQCKTPSGAFKSRAVAEMPGMPAACHYRHLNAFARALSLSPSLSFILTHEGRGDWILLSVCGARLISVTNFTQFVVVFFFFLSLFVNPSVCVSLRRSFDGIFWTRSRGVPLVIPVGPLGVFNTVWISAAPCLYLVGVEGRGEGSYSSYFRLFASSFLSSLSRVVVVVRAVDGILNWPQASS